MIGSLSVIGFVFALSAIVFGLLKATIGLRPSAEEEELGSDAVEVGIESYPYFK